MRRLPWPDAILLVILVPCWIAAFVLHVRQVVTGRLAWPPVYVSRPDGPENLPVVVGFRPEANRAQTHLEIGDRLVSAGRAELRGTGPVGVFARIVEQADATLHVPIVYEREGRPGTTELRLVPVAFAWRFIPLTLPFALVGVLVLLRIPGSMLARVFLLAVFSFSFHWTFFFGGPRLQSYLWAAVLTVSSLFAFPLLLRVPMIFPTEIAPAEGRLPRWPWLFTVLGPIAFSYVFGVPLPPAAARGGLFLVNIAFIVALLAVLTRNFRRCGPIGRRQVKWVLYGMYVGTVPVLAADVATTLFPALWWLHDLAVAAEAVIPLSILVAILRFNLFDIDRLISAAALYSFLLAVLLAALPTIVLPSARWLSASAGLEQSTVQLLLSGFLATGLVWVRGRTRPYVDQTFFPERYQLAGRMNALLRELSAAPDRGALFDAIATGLQELLRPALCAAYVRTSDGFQLVQVAGGPEGAAVPSGLPLAHPLLSALHAGTGPLDLQGERAAGGLGRVQAPSQSLPASVVLPVHRGDVLACIILLGGKRSGDVYTTADLGLLGALGHSVSIELLRLDLERYTPSKLSEAIKRRPEELEPRIGEVTIMFSDIRDSTTIAEALTPAAFRELHQQYFTTMDDIISRHDGLLVKTIGDAVMAVWNAPEPVPDHALRCCQAAVEMQTALEGLNANWSARGWPRVDIRIGVATGDAAVGVFGTGRHVEFDVRGDTVNLTSRLEGLNKAYRTRILAADATRVAVGDRLVFRPLDRVRVVGKTRAVEVYELLGSPAPDLDGLAHTFAAAVAAYRRRAFAEARTLLERITSDYPDDGPAAVYVDRCRAYLATPPGPDWDAVFEPRTK